MGLGSRVSAPAGYQFVSSFQKFCGDRPGPGAPNQRAVWAHVRCSDSDAATPQNVSTTEKNFLSFSAVCCRAAPASACPKRSNPGETEGNVMYV